MKSLIKSTQILKNSKLSILLILGCLIYNFINAQTNTSYNTNSMGVTGSFNSVIGYQTLFSNTSGVANSTTGANALYSNTSGNSNTAIGNGSAQNNTTGNNNCSLGAGSLAANTSGSQNIAVGTGSMSSNTTGTNNTVVGYFSNVGSSNLTNATALGNGSIVTASNAIQLGNSSVTQVFAGTGTNATLITGGLQVTGGTLAAGNVLTSDAFGVATWQPAGNSSGWTLLGNAGTVDGTNFIGTTDAVPFNIRIQNKRSGRIDFDGNSFYGFLAGKAGKFNTAIGDESMTSNSSGLYNTSLGYKTLYSNTSGNANIAVGNNCLFSNMTGFNNIAIGDQALYFQDQGYGNVAIGSQTLYSSTFNTGCTAIGDFCLHDNTVGNFNTGIGNYALIKNTTGGDNTAVGSIALYYNTTGRWNTAVGSSALSQLVDGDANSAFGLGALAGSTTTASQNTGIGGYSLYNNNFGSNNSGLGYYSNVSSGSLNNATAIGAGAMVNSSNKIRLGSTLVTVVEGPVAYTVSDGRFKNNVKEEDVKGLEFIKLLRPVVYNFDTKKFQSFLIQNLPDSVKKEYLGKDFTKSTNIRQSGFIAQEVEEAAKKVNYDFNGVHIPESKDDNYSLAYAEFVVPLVKAVQELSKENEEMKKELAEIKSILKTNQSQKTEGSVRITTSDSKAELFQNAPNPFNKSTIIRYTVPNDTKKAIILITSSTGNKIKEFDVKSNKNLEIGGNKLAAGTYIYSLIVDDILIDSKQMILTQ